MDASRDASVAELRRAYLKASVLVHPDKNQHPQATRAFQRVPSTAKEPSSIQELQEGDQNDEIQLSPEEAFAAFAFAAACAGGGAGFGDMAETLFWAQQLGLSRPMASCPGIAGLAGCGGGVGGGSNDAVQATTQGLCLSLGLYSAGLVISFLGLPRIGSFARRMALVQGVSQVVIASQVPAVRMACHTASMQAQEALGNFASQHPDWTQPIFFLLPMGCKGSKTQVDAPTTNSKAEIQAETTLPEKEDQVWGVAGESPLFVPQMDDVAGAPKTCTFCCA
eukprot:symbB.v1.2.015364.t4/scaffold1145.1/size135521/1